MVSFGFYKYTKMNGFTLMELLIAVAILGILTAAAIPAYTGYIQNSKELQAKSNLRAIYMSQQEYFSNNNSYYSTGAACGDFATTINTNLFDGTTILDNNTYDYCILQTTTSDFTAHAQDQGSADDFTITDKNVTNF